MIIWHGLDSQGAIMHSIYLSSRLRNPTETCPYHLEPVAKAINSTGKMLKNGLFWGWTSNSNLETSETSGIWKPIELEKKNEISETN